MSTPFQPIAHLVGYTRVAHQRLTNNLTAIPVEHLNDAPSGCARTALNIAAECALINGYAAEGLTTGALTRLVGDDRTAHLASFTTLESTLAYLDEKTAQLIAAIEALDESNLGETTELFGRPMSLFAFAELPASHMSYHDGQIAYIQTLHGDSTNYWLAPKPTEPKA